MIAGTDVLWQAQASLASYWRTNMQASAFMWSAGDAWETNMNDLRDRIDELAQDGRLGIAVVNGALTDGTPFTPEKWKDIHHTLWDSVTDQAKINQGSASIWHDFIVPTATNVATGVGDTAKEIKDILDFLTSPLFLLLIFGVLLMLVVYKVSA